MNTQEARLNLEDEIRCNDAVSFRILQLFRVFWIRRFTVFRIVFAGVVIAVAYSLTLPAVFTSTASLMPPENGSSSTLLSLLSSVSVAASTTGGSLLGVKTPGAIFVGIMGSRTVQERIVKRFNLVRDYRVPSDENACGVLAENSRIFEDPKNGIIRISVDAKTPQLAAKLAYAYVEELDYVITQNSTSAAGRERVFLQTRLEEIKKDLDSSGQALSQFSVKNRTIDVPSQGKEMIAADLKLQAELAIARSDLAGMRQAYSEDNVRVRAANARVGALQKQVDRMSGLSEQRSAKAVNGADLPSISQLPTLGLTYSELSRKVHVDEAVWEALTKQYESARVQEAKEIPIVRVLDAASLPEHKSAPSRSLIVILGGMLSFFVASIYVLARAAWEDMDEHDERKKMVRQMLEDTRASHAWFRNMRHAKARN
jgi:uncharacterized protein involved in exopolysaccharide biosynthesis